MTDDRVTKLFEDSPAGVLWRAEKFTLEELAEFAGLAFPPELRERVRQDIIAERVEYYEHDKWKRSLGVDNLLGMIPMVAFDELTPEQVGRLAGSVLRYAEAQNIRRGYDDCRLLAAHCKMGWDEFLGYAEHINPVAPTGQGLISALASAGIPASYLADAGHDLSRYYNVKDIELAWRAKLPAEYLYTLPLMSREYTAGIIASQFRDQYPGVDEYLRKTLRSHPYSVLMLAGGTPSPTVMKVAMWMHGVTPEYARATEPMSAQRVIECAKALVPADYALGLSSLPVEEVIGFWEADIPLEYARAARSA